MFSFHSTFQGLNSELSSILHLRTPGDFTTPTRIKRKECANHNSVCWRSSMLSFLSLFPPMFLPSSPLKSLLRVQGARCQPAPHRSAHFSSARFRQCAWLVGSDLPSESFGREFKSHSRGMSIRYKPGCIAAGLSLHGGRRNLPAGSSLPDPQPPPPHRRRVQRSRS